MNLRTQRLLAIVFSVLIVTSTLTPAAAALEPGSQYSDSSTDTLLTTITDSLSKIESMCVFQAVCVVLIGFGSRRSCGIVPSLWTVRMGVPFTVTRSVSQLLGSSPAPVISVPVLHPE